MKTKLVRPVLVTTNDIDAKLTMYHNGYRNQDGSFDYCELSTNLDHLQYHTNQRLILISLDPDEKIEVGDTGYINIGGGTIGEISYDNKYHTWDLTTSDNIHYPFSTREYIKKVIATQDQLSPDLINQLVAEYNNGGMQDFEIEMEIQNIGVLGLTEANWGIKLTNGFVTIVEKEHNIPYPEEPMEEDGELVYLDRRLGILNDPKINGVDYENTPVPDYPIVYTEEEVYDLITKFDSCYMGKFMGPDSREEWFNKNKKK